MDAQKIAGLRGMELHDAIYIRCSSEKFRGEEFIVTRVINGWIYRKPCGDGNMIFVPETL